MADDLMTDEEQVERLRQWWSEYGMLIIAGVVLGLGLLFGGQAWRDHREGRLATASDLYQEVLDAVGGGDIAAARDLAQQLAAEFPQSPYDTQAQLAVAKLEVESGELDTAVNTLAAAVTSAEDERVAAVARSRQARVLIALERPEEALAVLGSQPLAKFAALHYELTGDALVRMGRAEEARTAYNDALGALDASGDPGLIQLKIAALGPSGAGGAMPMEGATSDDTDASAGEEAADGGAEAEGEAEGEMAEGESSDGGDEGAEGAMPEDAPEAAGGDEQADPDAGA